MSKDNLEVLDEDLDFEVGDLPYELPSALATEQMPFSEEEMAAIRARNTAGSTKVADDFIPDDEDIVEEDVDMSGVSEAEMGYRSEVNTPKVEVKTNTVVREVIRNVADESKPTKEPSTSDTDLTQKIATEATSEVVKQVVSAVLDNETNEKISQYEKRRKRRERNNRLSFLARLVVIVVIGVFLYRNDATRERIQLVAYDTVDLVKRIVTKDPDHSSNKLVNDVLGGMGKDLNEINTVEVDGEEIY